MSGRAMVTGATGLLGSYIVERLLAEEWEVRALVRTGSRSGAPAAWLAARGVTLVEGSLEDRASLTCGATGCDALFHTAAMIGSGGAGERFFRINVEGTRNVVAAAESARARLVHVSSTAVYGRARYRACPTDEEVDLPELPAHDVYGRSKQEAEAVVLAAVRAGRVWGAVVRPPVMYGRRDRQFLPRLGGVMEKGIFPRIAGGRTTLTLVHAGSVAEGAVLAAKTDAARGRVYLLANDRPVTVTDLVRCAEAGLGRRIWSPVVPTTVGRLGFMALAGLLRARGRWDLARHAAGTLEMLTRDNPFTSERARLELGWSPSVCDASLVDAFRWWRAHRGTRES